MTLIKQQIQLILLLKVSSLVKPTEYSFKKQEEQEQQAQLMVLVIIWFMLELKPTLAAVISQKQVMLLKLQVGSFVQRVEQARLLVWVEQEWGLVQVTFEVVIMEYLWGS